MQNCSVTHAHGNTAIGCHFVDSDLELTKHMEEDINSHLEYICSFLLSCSHSSHKPNVYAPTIDDNETMKKLQAKIECVSDEGDKTKLQAAEMQGKQKDIAFWLDGLEDLLIATQASIAEINCIYEDISVDLQTLQAMQ